MANGRKVASKLATKWPSGNSGDVRLGKASVVVRVNSSDSSRLLAEVGARSFQLWLLLGLYCEC